MTYILSLATATPPHGILQGPLAQKMARASSLNDTETKWLERVYANSHIKTRYSVLEDFGQEVNKWHFWNNKAPTTKERNEVYKKEAPKLAHQASWSALKAWGQNPSLISHIIFVSCTGMMAPGIQAHLQQSLGLRPDVNQFGLNFMGCFGAFKALDMARAFANLNPSNRILVVCTELCSLHFQQEPSKELQIGNAIFADGSAACIVGQNPTSQEKPLWQIIDTKSQLLANTFHKMTWEVSDTGFVLGLKSDVPALIHEHVREFATALLPQTVSVKECLWPIHPGGKNILLAVQEALGLSSEQTQSSWDVFEQYGNVSSPTFLYVLDNMRQKRALKEWSVGLGFGPGLCFEGILLKNLYHV